MPFPGRGRKLQILGGTNMSSEIRDINLAESGEQKIEWVRRNCDLLRMLEEEFSQSKPFAGKKVTLSVHLEAKTAYLCKVLAAGGAEMYVTGSNPLSTQMMWRRRWLRPGWRFMPGMEQRKKNTMHISVQYCPQVPISSLMTAGIWCIWFIRKCRS